MQLDIVGSLIFGLSIEIEHVKLLPRLIKFTLSFKL